MYLLILILSSISHAIVDTLRHRFKDSIFIDKKPRFWNPEVSSISALKVFSFSFDAVTIFGQLTLVLLILTSVLCQLTAFRISATTVPIYIQAPASITIYVSVYNVFLNHLFVKKKT